MVLTGEASANWQMVGPYSGRSQVVETPTDEIWIRPVAGRLIGVSNICPHKMGPLADGESDGEMVECPWHGFRFHLFSGECLNGRCPKLRRYEVKLKDNMLFVKER